MRTKTWVSMLALLLGHLVRAVEPPQIAYVSVDPATEKITVAWYKSPETNVNFLRLSIVTNDNGQTISGETIKDFTQNTDNEYSFSIDNVSSITSTQINKSYLFAIAASLGSSISPNYINGHSTIFTTVKFTTCPNKMSISWTKYKGYGATVAKYNIYDFNNGAPELVGSVAGDQSTFDYEVTEGNGESCYYVEAEMTDLKGIAHKSTSNKACAQVKLPVLPAYLVADYATVANDNQIDLSFSIDTSSDITHYILARSDKPKGPYLTVDSGDFKTVKTPQLTYSAKGDSIALKLNYYKIYAIGECGDTVLASNAASNIVLNIKESAKSNDLGWTGYYEWPGGVKVYEVYRSVDDGAFEDIHHEKLNDDSITYRDMIEQLAQDGQKVCYYVVAYPENPKNPNAKSTSNQRCVTRESRVFIPDAFNPSSPVAENRLFKPVVAFINLGKYEFKVFNRWNELVFHTQKTTEAWDGTYKSKMASEGTYIYYLKYENEKGTTVEKHGTFNLIFNE